jgi:hypothetical protein
MANRMAASSAEQARHRIGSDQKRGIEVTFPLVIGHD